MYILLTVSVCPACTYYTHSTCTDALVWVWSLPQCHIHHMLYSTRDRSRTIPKRAYAPYMWMWSHTAKAACSAYKLVLAQSCSGIVYMNIQQLAPYHQVVIYICERLKLHYKFLYHVVWDTHHSRSVFNLRLPICRSDHCSWDIWYWCGVCFSLKNSTSKHFPWWQPLTSESCICGNQRWNRQWYLQVIHLKVVSMLFALACTLHLHDVMVCNSKTI